MNSATEEDLEGARQRLLEHQYDQDAHHTEPVNEIQPATLEIPYQNGVPPPPLRGGNYGSVSTLQSAQQKTPTKIKRYRLPFLILLAFDFGMVIFLSIICSEVIPSVFVNIVQSEVHVEGLKSRAGQFWCEVILE